MTEKKASPAAKKTKAAEEGVRVDISPFRTWADQPEDAAIAELCEFLVTNSTQGHLANFARQKGFAYVTVLDWIKSDTKRSEMYARTREDRADMLADEIVSISDEQEVIVKGGEDEDTPVTVVFDPTAVARNKLRVDARKWAAAKLKPKVYGDKIALGGADDLPPLQHSFAMSDDALLAIAAKAGAK